jgi:type VI protein secretion system component VasK
LNDATTTDRLRERLDRESGKPPGDLQGARPRSRDWLLGLGALCILVACLAFGAWRSYQQYRQVLQTVEQRRDFIPNVRVSTVRASDGLIRVTLPATTLAFAQAMPTSAIA